MTRIVEDWEQGFSLSQYGDEVDIDLLYPRNNLVRYVQVGLVDVRAADNVRLWYDFYRDGWVVEQASVFEWGEDDETDCDPDWQEVAFVPAWGRKRAREGTP